MAQIEIRDWNNKVVRTRELDAAVFDYPLKEHLIYEAVLAHQAAGRSGSHKTKNRVEVSGGTRKLWKQKHTGRARMGDNRSPLWRHGGTVHGPQPRDYSWRLPKRMRRNALRSVLAHKFREGKLVCVEGLEFPTAKTRELEKVVGEKLGLDDSVLLVPGEEQGNLELAARNNPRLAVVRALGVSVVDLLAWDTVVFSESGLAELSEVLGR